MLREWTTKLGQLLKKCLTPRFLKDKLAGIGISLTNMGVLLLFVDGLGLNPIAVSIARAIVMMQVGFLIRRNFTWRDCRHLPAWPQWRRHMALKTGTTAAKQALFALLVLAGLPYLVAHIVCTAAGGAINFYGSDKFVFAA